MGLGQRERDATRATGLVSQFVLAAVPAGALWALSELGRPETPVFVEKNDDKFRLGSALEFAFLGELMLATWAVESLLLFLTPAALRLLIADLNSPRRAKEARRALGLQDAEKDKREQETTGNALQVGSSVVVAAGLFNSVSATVTESATPVLNANVSPKLDEPLKVTDEKRRKFVGALKSGAKIESAVSMPALSFVRNPELEFPAT